MPTYEYHCDTCDENFDVVQSFHDDPLSECPTCGSPVRKVFGNVGIVFKGSGFYKTDSRNGGSSKSADGGTPSTDQSGSEKTSTSDDGTQATPMVKDSPSSAATSPSKPAKDPSKSGKGKSSDSNKAGTPK